MSKTKHLVMEGGGLDVQSDDPWGAVAGADSAGEAGGRG